MLATFTFSGILVWCYVDFQLFKLPVSFICIVKETFILFVFVYVGGACMCFSMETRATNSLELQLHLGCELPGLDSGNKTRVS